MQVSSLRYFQELYEAAKEDDGVRLGKAIAAVEDAARESESLYDARSQAYEMYAEEKGSREVQIDDHNTHHNGTDGTWVMGWLWVPDEDK